MNLNPYTASVLTEEELGRLPDHTSPADLALMANAINALQGPDRVFFGARLWELGLMNPILEDETEAAINALRQLGQLGAAAMTIFTASPESLDEFIEGTVNHLTSGKDLSDERSAGGWNNEELLDVYAVLYVARRGLSIPFGANVQ